MARREEGAEEVASAQGSQARPAHHPGWPQNPARLTPYKTGRAANGLGLRPGRWDRRPEMSAPPLKGFFFFPPGCGKAQPVASEALPAPKESSHSLPPPRSPGTGELPCCWRAGGRGIPAGTEAARNHRNDTVLGELRALPGLGHPLV